MSKRLGDGRGGPWYEVQVNEGRFGWVCRSRHSSPERAHATRNSFLRADALSEREVRVVLCEVTE